jgi:hypothetical protein
MLSMPPTVVRQHHLRRSHRSTRCSTIHLKGMQELSSDSMALNRNSSDEPTKSKYAPPLDSDSHEDYNPSSPSSSPPPVIRNTSFKLFAASHAQRRAITEKSSTAALTNTAKPVNADKSTRIPSNNTYVTAKDAPRDKVAGLTDLRSLIDDAKQKARASATNDSQHCSKPCCTQMRLVNNTESSKNI